MAAPKRFCTPTILALAVILSACTSQRQSVQTAATLVDLDSKPQQAMLIPSPESKQDATQLYLDALEVTDDPALRLHLNHRLADLESQQHEAGVINDSEGSHKFDKAIERYELLLQSQPDSSTNDKILYQLAKIHELEGNLDRSLAVLDELIRHYPSSTYIAEAQFRRGEILFSQQQYQSATTAYNAVLLHGDTTPFYEDALYMMGWSQFKQGGFQDCLESFTEILDSVIPADGTLTNLERSDKDTAEDSLHVMSMVFSYQQGPASIEAAFKPTGKRNYHHLLYESLASLYLGKFRYRDAADTYSQFIQLYPSSPYTLGFSLNVVETYEQADFPSLVMVAKRDFVDNFGVNSDYWQNSGVAIHDEIRPHLRSYLGDLAQYEHASGQLILQQKKDTSKKSAQQAFGRASLWYQQFTETFPEDSGTPEMVFLMGETLYEAGDYPAAIEAYKRVAYDYRDSQRGAEAGYAAIMVYQNILDNSNSESGIESQEARIHSSIQFSDSYSEDPRAVAVLAQAARDLLMLQKYDEAIAVSSRVTTWQPTPAIEWQLAGWLVQAQALFDLENYSCAERAYTRALALVPDDDASHSGIVERLAASVYKSGELHLQSNDKRLAVENYLRVSIVAPESPVAAQAQYDAAVLLLELESWQEAEQEFVHLRQAYPQNALLDDVPPQLAEAYLQQEKYGSAAREYSLISETEEDAEIRRVSLYLAAEMFQRSGQTLDAIDHYQRYSETYPTPAETQAEAQFQLATLYAETGDEDTRRQWLQHLIDSDSEDDYQATERTRYLASSAQAVFANDAYQIFARNALVLPLQKSLQTKRKSMQTALSAYEQLLSYEIGEFVSLSNYRIGQMYVRLSIDLMDSERPSHLNPLELEQYELMLEELVYPFEETAIKIHETNTRRVLSGFYDDWVRKSFKSLATLLPVRYDKHEKIAGYTDELR